MVSIVIPTYNRSHVISEAIDSIIQQSYKNWELIIVDDGSSDGTETLIRDKYDSREQISYFKIDNSGATHARNVGASHARGKYLTFLDSDDVAHVDWLAKLTNQLKLDNCALISCGVRYIKADLSEEISLPQVMSPAFFGYRMKSTNGGSFMLTLDLFRKVGGYDSNLRSGQHTELGMRLAGELHASGQSVSNLDEPLVDVINRGGASIRGDGEATYAGILYFIKKHRDFLTVTDPIMLSNFLSVAGVRADKMGAYKDARAYLQESVKLQPFRLINLARLARVYVHSLGMGRKH